MKIYHNQEAASKIQINNLQSNDRHLLIEGFPIVQVHDLVSQPLVFIYTYQINGDLVWDTFIISKNTKLIRFSLIAFYCNFYIILLLKTGIYTQENEFLLLQIESFGFPR